MVLRPGEADTMRHAAEFRLERSALQAVQLERLANDLPLPQLTMPYLFDNEIGFAQLERLAAALLDDISDLAPSGVSS